MSRSVQTVSKRMDYFRERAVSSINFLLLAHCVASHVSGHSCQSKRMVIFGYADTCFVNAGLLSC